MICNKNINIKKPFIDSRGSILKIIQQEFHSCLLINSKQFSVRANHYHKKDSHFIYILEGELIYFYKSLKKNSPLKMDKFTKKNLFYTPPLFEHLLFFTKETTFLVFSPHKRTKKQYESDLVRLEMLSYQKIQELISKYKRKKIKN